MAVRGEFSAHDIRQDKVLDVKAMTFFFKIIFISDRIIFISDYLFLVFHISYTNRCSYSGFIYTTFLN
jgi:hypothetical protein